MNSLNDDGSKSLVTPELEGAVGGSVLIPDEEEAIKSNCDNFKEFLTNLRARNYKGQSDCTRKALAELKANMSEFLSEGDSDIDVNDNKGDKLLSSCVKSTQNSNRQETKSKGTENNENKNLKPRYSKLKRKPSVASSSDSGEEPMKETDDKKSSSETSSSSECGASSSSRSKHERNRKRKSKSKTELTDFAEVLLKLDNRRIPEQDKFNEDSGQDFIAYMEQFEEYCMTNFKGHQNLWMSELGRHLQGRMLQNYYSLKESCKGYHELKEKLIIWYTDNQEIRSRKCKKKFENAQIKSNESIYLYSVRLESLYRVAFPNHSVKRSHTLLRKFKNSIPTSTKQNLKATIMFNKMRDKDTNWKEVQKWARLQDIENESNDEEFRTIKPVREVTINLSDLPQVRGQRGGKHENTKNYFRENQRNNENTRQYNNQTRIDARTSSNIPIYTYNAQCTVCHRFGHNPSNCRTRLRQCFVCGNAGHFIRDCPRYYRNSNHKYTVNSHLNRVGNNTQQNYTYPNNFVPKRSQSMTRYMKDQFSEQPMVSSNARKVKQRRSLSQSGNRNCPQINNNDRSSLNA